MDNLRPELSTIVAKWQKILRLQDWLITAKYERAFNMDDCSGRATWHRRLKAAEILILDPIDYKCKWEPVQDIEETVVHEMLHIHFALVDDYAGLSLDVFEQCIDLLAQAFVALDRRDGKTTQPYLP